MIKNGSGQIGPRKRFVGANWDPNFFGGELGSGICFGGKLGSWKTLVRQIGPPMFLTGKLLVAQFAEKRQIGPQKVQNPIFRQIGEGPNLPRTERHDQKRVTLSPLG